MSETIIVGSRAHVAVSIAEPPPNPEKPGEAPAAPVIIINGSNAPETKVDMGITRGVDAKVFRAWLENEKKANTPLSTMMMELTEDDLSKPDAESFGFEPGLEAMKSDSENTQKATEGSTVKHEGPAKSTEMAATSNTPNDDTPRGDPDIVPVKRSQEPATAITSGG